MNEITLINVQEAQDEMWNAILSFANNRNLAIGSDLAEDVSIAITNFGNLCYLLGVNERKEK